MRGRAGGARAEALAGVGGWRGVGRRRVQRADRRVTGRRGGWEGHRPPGRRPSSPLSVGEGALCWTLASGPSAFAALPWDPAASRPRLFPALPLAFGCSPSPTVPRIPEPRPQTDQAPSFSDSLATFTPLCLCLCLSLFFSMFSLLVPLSLPFCLCLPHESLLPGAPPWI